MNMLIPFCSMIVGIAFAMIGADMYVGIICIIIGLTVQFFTTQAKQNPVKTYRSKRFSFLFPILLFVGVGIITTDLARPWLVNNDDFSGYLAAEGEILEKNSYTYGDLLISDINWLIDRGGNSIRTRNLRVLITSDATDAEPGDICAFPANFIRITDNPNSFFGGDSLWRHRQGLHYRMNVSGEQIKLLRTTSSFRALSEKCRNKIVEFIELRPLKKSTRYFLISILTGDRRYLDPELRSLYTNAGISHVLALSGLHIGIIAGLIMLLLFPLNFVGRYKLRLILTTIFLWAYAFISGCAPSTLRASVMITFVIIGLILERKSIALNALLASGFIILLIDPFDIFDIGFQLSFICVGSILLFVPRFSFMDHKKHSILYRITSAIIVTIITTVVTWPLIGCYFGIFPLSFFSVNILFLPLFPLFLTVSIIYLLLASMGIEFSALRGLLDISLDQLNSMITTLSQDSLNILEIEVPDVAAWIWIAACVIMAVGFSTNRFRIYAAVSSVMMIGSLGFIILHSSRKPRTGILFTTEARKIEVKFRYGMKEYPLCFPRDSVSRFSLYGRHILCIDAERWPHDTLLSSPLPDFTIIAGGIRSNPEEWPEILRNTKLIIHPSVRKKREGLIRVQADSMGIPVHSLRIDGALRIDSP